MKSVILILTCCLLHSALYAKISVGQLAPSLGSQSSYNTKDKKAVHLKKYRGKVVLIDFWATWCGPCIRAMPHMQELHDKYGKKGLVIIAHTDKSSRNVSDFIKKNKYSFIFSVGKNIGDDFGVEGIPHAVLLDTEGKVLWDGHSGSVPKNKIESELKKVKKGAGSNGVEYPFFETQSKNSRIKRYQADASKGRIGNSIKGLEKYVETLEDAGDKKSAETTLNTLNEWVKVYKESIENKQKEGMLFEAYNELSVLSKALTGHSSQKEYKTLMTDLKKEDAYKAGKAFYKLQISMTKKNESIKKKSYLKFSEKYSDTYYGKKAGELAN